MNHSLPAQGNGRRHIGSEPWLHQQGVEVQEFGTIREFPLGLSRDTRLYSCQRLNQVLADTQILYALYKKHHWLMRGATFYQLHLLLDKHAGEQLELVDMVAERVQTLGGVAVGDPRHVAEITVIARPPNGAEEVPAMLSRLLEAHETILVDAHGRTTGVVPGRAPGGHPPRAGLTTRRAVPGRGSAGRCGGDWPLAVPGIGHRPTIPKPAGIPRWPHDDLCPGNVAFIGVRVPGARRCSRHTPMGAGKLWAQRFI